MSKNGLVSRRKSGLGRTGIGTFVPGTSRAPRKVYSSIYSLRIWLVSEGDPVQEQCSGRTVLII